ncbi:cobalamin biosynthesis protein CobD [Hominisplanchenecus murintestinalis]|uniref:Cobalamin biosynthesis protein CobD n=1 Tax=Hominisplanchenecus murintestinalis TaxID=2941517 RepID=A0AC61QZC5_9FIRM|nr:adenosylcobinamide-phosphate synthase CbiB [Hominisplanchenecus murintestinalis]TGX98982.1 cobalamin biosynthesis protein CobD [Hominisplanchenecus murintestinalis]
MVKWTVWALILGFIIDLLVGDPRWLYHPVRMIGNGISFLEKGLRKILPDTPGGERTAGLFLVILICAFGGGIPFLVLYGAYQVHTGLGLALETFWCYQMLAAKSLKEESMRVYRELEEGNLKGARYAVSMIVGRDTENLTAEGVTKAAVETVAENTSDGVIAPLFYMALGGVPLLFLYKSINTMDSMVGYKNEKYLNFGRYAAKLDDVANYLPARISAWLMIAASYMGGFDGKHAVKIFFRDRYHHASPNSAQTEAVMAGALHIQLAGNAWYFGELYEKPTIGDADRPIEYEDIRRSNCLLYRSAALGAFLFAALRLGIMAVIAMC